MWACQEHVLMAQTADSETRGGFYPGSASSIAFSRDLLQRLMMDKCSQGGDEDNKNNDDGLKESEDEEMELNLGLSLGGCHGHGKGKREKEKEKKGGSGDLLQPVLRRKDLGESGGDGGFERDGYDHGNIGVQKSDEGGVDFAFGVKQEGGMCEMKQGEVPEIQDPRSTAQQQQEMLEQQKKRELHALRRQEARKKREEKQLQRARREVGAGGMKSLHPNRGRNGFVPLAPSYATHFPMRGASTVGIAFPLRVGTGPLASEEDKRVLGAQMSSIKEKHRAAKENEPCRSDRKDFKEGDPSVEDKNSRASHETENMVSGSNGRDPPASNEVSGPERSMPVSQAAYPVLPMSYPFPVLTGNPPPCMPLPMGYSFPYVMPFWPPAASTGHEASKSSVATPPLPPNVLQPIPTRAFPPFQMPISGTSQASWFADPQARPGTGPAHSSHASGASSGRSSSAVSEYESRSSQGASSNETKSQSSTSAMEPLQRISSISKSQDQTLASSEVSTASQLEPTKSAEMVTLEKVTSNAAQSALVTSTTTTMQEKQITETSSSTKGSQQHVCPSSPKTNDIDNTKTSKDDQAHQGQCSLSMPNMPCVSTTGEDGKTVNGFLYSYSKGEVCIVCVCHGRFLSPAQFVQHAGGIDLLHPERHIVVNPSLCAMQDASHMG
uniref:Tify domain-containing protein n=1 Tax=Araucaria cunninghamii TaxID=56994 RepID=A0A0D6QXI8_ARACU